MNKIMIVQSMLLIVVCANIRAAETRYIKLEEDQSIVESGSIEVLKEGAKSGNVESVKRLIKQGPNLRNHFFVTILKELENKSGDFQGAKEFALPGDAYSIETSIGLIKKYLTDNECNRWSTSLEEQVKQGQVDKVKVSLLNEEECVLRLAHVIESIKAFVTEQKAKGKLVEGTPKYQKIKASVELLQNKQRELSRTTFEYVRSHSYKK